MLGKVKPKAGWIWHADGKHPAAKDFLKIGNREPLLQAVIDWASAGFRQMTAGRKSVFDGNSWRFWTGGNRRSHIICGVMRDSCDSFGRSFPLTILGTGPLKDWDTHWDLLPLALDKTWQQIEYLATKRHLDFSQLENEVHTVPIPTNNWAEFDPNEHMPGHVPAFGQPAELNSAGGSHITPGGKDPLLEIIPLNSFSQDDPPLQIARLQAVSKKRLPHAPNAVFVGGIPEKSWLVMFKRPLRQSDFTKLWSLSEGEGLASKPA